MTDVIDLDAFTTESVTVALNGKEIKINPPRTRDVLRIGTLASRLQGTKDNDLETLEKSFVELAEALKKCAPDLDVDALNMTQLLKLVSIITDLATPKDSKELDERGITVDADPKVA